MQLTNYFIPALAIPFLLLACIVYFDAFYKGNQVKAEIVALGKSYTKIVLFSVIGYLITFCLMVSNIYKLTLFTLSAKISHEFQHLIPIVQIPDQNVLF